jgi:VCBS repeat protein
MRLKSRGTWILTFLFCLVVQMLSRDSEKVLRHSRFDDFIQGKPGNSGANLFVSRSGRVQVINKWDLNQDGYVDVVISNDHDVIETVDAFIYWGTDQGPQSILPELWKDRPLAQVVLGLMSPTRNLTRLPAFGGGRSVIADLNRDGYPEVVFCNYIHNYPGLRTAFVYWGGADGYQASHKTELPTNWAAGVAAADLNGDGYSELVLANQGVEAGSEDISPDTGFDSYIYWGSATGFDPAHPTLLGTRGAKDVTIADINKDNFPDIAFVNSGAKAKELQVFWGGPSGYSNDRSQSLPLPDPTSIRSFDINRDGYADVVVTTAAKAESISLEAAKTGEEGTHSVYLLFGSPTGVDPKKSVTLPTYEARDSCIGDFNRDGFADIAIANTSNGKKAKVESFVYWGSDKGFLPERRSALPTLGASGVASADLNRDGHPDLVFANARNAETHDVPSYIYWGSASGFAPYLRSELQSFGAASVNTADLNGDGKPEVLLVNQYSGEVNGQVQTHIFWGNAHSYYSSASMTRLPGRGSYDTSVADFDDDGFADLVLTNSYVDVSYLYWGGKEGFSVERRTELPSGTVFGSSAADLNRDGYLDLVFTGRASGNSIATIFWGSPNGFLEPKKTVLRLKGKRSLSNVVADLNKDGFLDLVFPDEYFGALHIFWGSPEGYSASRSWSKFVSAGSLEMADLNNDGHLDYVIAGGFDPKEKSRNTRTRIFWGTTEGTPSPEGVIELEGYQSLECGIADLNRDGALDLVLSNYMSDTTRSLPLFIYWGSKDGHYSNVNRTDLPAESSAGVQTIDLNRDGYPEIIIHNHLRDGSHSINSYIYWNGPQGFDKNRRTELPNFGPHFSQMTDPGNQYTRQLEEEYVSSEVAAPHGAGTRYISWKAQEPHGAQLKFQVRSAGTREALNKAEWKGPQGRQSFYGESGSELKDLPTGSAWMQYRAVFTSPDGGEWPVLTEVEIGLR